MNQRKSISKKKRFEIFKRDKFTCQYCGGTPPQVVLHLDHIFPVSLGGSNNDDNLVSSCVPCNQGKAATPLSIIPKSLSEVANEISEREEQIRGYYEIMEKKRLRIDQEAWKIFDIYDPNFREKGIRKDWIRSVKMFIEKLGFYAVEEAMSIAFERRPYSFNKAFPYFCGVCWTKIRESKNG